MSEIHAQIKEAEAQIEQIKAVIEQRDRMVRLLDNADFRTLVLEGFCRDECARYTKVSVDPSMGADDRADALAIAQSAGYFQRWINAFLQMTNQAANDLPKLKELIEELRALPEEE
jgi:F0F1-type ATP synthase delta subunit